MIQPISPEELFHIIIKHAPPQHKVSLQNSSTLHLFQLRKMAAIIPIPKPGKHPSQAQNYTATSLLQTLRILIEQRVSHQPQRLSQQQQQHSEPRTIRFRTGNNALALRFC